MPSNTRFAVAIHLLTALAFVGDTRTSAELAKSVNTNPVFLRRILSRLVKAGLVNGQAGKKGGFGLARAATSITLLDVYRAVAEDPLFSVHGNAEAKACPVSCSIKGVLSDVFERAEGAAAKELKRTRLSDVLAEVPAPATP